MDKMYIFFLVFLTINLVKSTEIICEGSSMAQACELSLHANNTICERVEAFRSICPCTCDEHMGRMNETPDQSPEVDADSSDGCQNSELDQENDCQFRYRADPSICDYDNVFQYCPCTCQERSQNPEVQEEQPENTKVTNRDDDKQNVINPALCADIPDSKMEYDCQFRIASNLKLCNDPTYREMCRCTCSRFGNRATLEENVAQALLTPDDVLPIVLDEDNEADPPIDPERCPDYQDSDRSRGCFLRVTNLKGQPCPDVYREACPCTCMAQDEGELCPDSPWTPLSGVCQMRANNGECSDFKVREDCPCTCAFVPIPDTPGVEANPSETPDSRVERPHTSCIDTASARSCRYFVRNNMCESQYQYCRRSCNMCSHEPVPDGEEPIVNSMPDVDHPDEDENTEEGSGEICEDKSTPAVCESYKERGLCATRWTFCQRTCDACRMHIGENITSAETDIETEDEDEEKYEEEEHEEGEDDQEDEEQDQLEGEQEEEVDEQEEIQLQQEQQPCMDSISSALCENYVRTNRCFNWWRYCRRTCNVCEENPYLETPRIPFARPGGSTPNMNGLDRCPQCQLYESMGGCERVDRVVKEYCQIHCDMCLSEGELVLDDDEGEEGEFPLEGEDEEKEGELLLGEGEDEEPNDENQEILIDDEDTLNEGSLLPELCRHASDDNVHCAAWYRDNHCELNPLVREVCSWSCNHCNEFIQIINENEEVIELGLTNEENEEDEAEKRREEEEEQEEEGEEKEHQEEAQEQEQEQLQDQDQDEEQEEEQEEQEQEEQEQEEEEEHEEEETEIELTDGNGEEIIGETIELEDAGATAVPAQTDCEDIADWCSDYVGYCTDPHYAQNMKINCRKTCQHC